tara:strand:- start:674 stop:910 length:237 start_codon:yes stop_codon:yes gene_type:complete
MSIKTEVTNILIAILNVPSSVITLDSSPETIENWDSLKHIKIISALEEEYSLEFSDEEILEMLVFSSMINLIEKKLKG